MTAKNPVQPDDVIPWQVITTALRAASLPPIGAVYDAGIAMRSGAPRGSGKDPGAVHERTQTGTRAAHEPGTFLLSQPLAKSYYGGLLGGTSSTGPPTGSGGRADTARTSQCLFWVRRSTHRCSAGPPSSAANPGGAYREICDSTTGR